MMTCKRFGAGGSRGYTLIELVLVMVIAATAHAPVRAA